MLPRICATCPLLALSPNLERPAVTGRAIAFDLLATSRRMIALASSRTSRARVPPHSGSGESAAPIRTFELASKRSRSQVTAASLADERAA